MSEWIDSKHKMPEKNGLYLCFIHNAHENGFFKIFYVVATFDNFHRPMFFSQCENITENVSYWMKIPEFPIESPT